MSRRSSLLSAPSGSKSKIPTTTQAQCEAANCMLLVDKCVHPSKDKLSNFWKWGKSFK